MYDFTSFFNYWDRLIEDWSNNPGKTISSDVYLSKYTPSSASPLYRGRGFDYYKYRPEPYLGNPDNCCAVMLNLNPGFGIPTDADEKLHPDYRLQHCEAVDKIHYDAKGFVPYLAGEFVNDPQHCVKSRADIPGGVFWWNGTYNRNIKKCTGGRIDYIHHLYNLYFGTQPDKLPFVLELCPWHSYNFSLRHIFPQGIPDDSRDELVRTINDYVITPALQATKGSSVLPFVICIGSAVKELAKVLNLETKPEWCWSEDSGMEKWPVRKDGKKVVRSYTLYHRDGCYLLNISAPGSNKPPGKGTFQTDIEPAIVKYIGSIVSMDCELDCRVL